MIKKASLLVLTGAITISSLGLTTTSFADVREENLLVQEMNAKSKNQVVTEQDGTVRVAGEDGQLGTADDVLVKPGLNGQAPQIDQFGNVTLPTGGRVIFANGTIVTDHVNEHSIITPGGSVVTPNDKGGAPTVNADGSVNVPEGSMVVLSSGVDTTPPKDSVVSSNGDITTLSGVSIKANGTVVAPGPDGKVAIQFTDISKHWAESTIKSFVNSKYINGYNDGTFRPDNLITRAEFVKILNKYFGLTNKSGKVFSDTSSHWAKEEIDIAVTNGIVNGFPDGTFKPEAPITREQASVMISNYKQISDKDLDKLNTYKDSSEVSDWAQASVEGVLEQGYMSGYPDKTFGPKKNLTRAEAVVTLSRIAK